MGTMYQKRKGARWQPCEVIAADGDKVHILVDGKNRWVDGRCVRDSPRRLHDSNEDVCR
jgi:hypothetical protein